MLLRLPTEVILQILFMCRIEDISTLERTSKSIRRIIISKYHWLIQLRNLSQVHAPSLTPGLEIKKLHLLELREIVLKAALTHRNWREGKAITEDTHVKSLTNFDSDDMPDIRPNVMVAPGGCNVFLIWPYSTPSPSEQKGLIKLFNMEKQCMKVWEYHGPEDSVDCCAIEMCKDGRIMVFLISLMDWGGFEYKSEWECKFEYDRSDEGRTAWFPCIAGDYAVFGIDEDIIVTNWVENWTFVLDRHVSFIRHMQIKSDHLIYIEELDGDDIWVQLSITPLKNSGNIIKNSWDLEKLVPAGFDLDCIPECVGICDFLWESKPSKSLLTVFLTLRRAGSDGPGEFCIGVQAVFDPESPKYLKFLWHTRVARHPFPPGRVEEDTAQIICTSQSTRSLLRLTFSRQIAEDVTDTEGPRDLQEQPQPNTSHSDTNGGTAPSKPRETVTMMFYMGLDERREIYFTPAPKSTNLDNPDYSVGMEPCSGALTLCTFERKSNRIEIIHPNVQHHTFPFLRKYKW